MSKKKVGKSTFLVVAVVWLAGGLLGVHPVNATLLTFDELLTQPVDDLSYMGVTFDFKVAGQDSPDAAYNSMGPGDLQYVQDPSLEGNSVGILTLMFENPVTDLQFGLALSVDFALTPGCVIDLYNVFDEPFLTIPLNTLPLVSFSEAQFAYEGDPIAKAVMDFEDDAGRFALDNLYFIPEPGSLLILSLGGLGLRRRRPTHAPIRR